MKRYFILNKDAILSLHLKIVQSALAILHFGKIGLNMNASSLATKNTLFRYKIKDHW